MSETATGSEGRFMRSRRQVTDEESPQTRRLPGALKRAFANFRKHEMTDVAASLTYYGMMSLFPTIVLAVSLFALIGDAQTISNAVDYLARQGLDASTQDTIRQAMTKIVNSSGGAVSFALVLSIALALNGASGAFGAAGRAINRVYNVHDDRAFVRHKLEDLMWTLLLVVLLLVVIVALFLGGGIAEDLLGTIGLGDTGATVWSIIRWPIALVCAMLTFGVIYAFAPALQPRRFRWISPGAVLGVVVWIVASIGFAIYIQNFSTYGAAYGAAGAALVLLLWLWLSSCALLFGAELNAELEREQTAGKGGPPFPTPPPAPSDATPPASAPRPAHHETR